MRILGRVLADFQHLHHSEVVLRQVFNLNPIFHRQFKNLIPHHLHLITISTDHLQAWTHIAQIRITLQHHHHHQDRTNRCHHRHRVVTVQGFEMRSNCVSCEIMFFTNSKFLAIHFTTLNSGEFPPPPPSRENNFPPPPPSYNYSSSTTPRPPSNQKRGNLPPPPGQFNSMPRQPKIQQPPPQPAANWSSKVSH